MHKDILDKKIYKTASNRHYTQSAHKFNMTNKDKHKCELLLFHSTTKENL